MQSYQSAQNESILERHIKFNRKSAGTRCLPVFGDETANSGSSCKLFFFFSLNFSFPHGKKTFWFNDSRAAQPIQKELQVFSSVLSAELCASQRLWGGRFTCTVPMVMGQTMLWPCMVMQNQTFRKAARGPWDSLVVKVVGDVPPI